MKHDHFDELKASMEHFLTECDMTGGNPELCYERLADDMANAAALVYDACMQGQQYAKTQS
jgi:hypothetical protein